MPTTELGLFESKARLSELIQRVLAGESFIITRRGQPVAELRPITREKRPLVRGGAKNGAFAMRDDFDTPLADFADDV